MVCKLREMTLFWVCMLLSLPTWMMAAESETSSGEANTYYEKGTTTRLKLSKRMALVGHNCTVGRLAAGVEVGTGSANLSNLCDEDLTNHCTIPSTLSATVLAGNPIISVKDTKHYFDKGTKAGFKISGESSVLQLSVLQNNYMIRFYKDGKDVGTSQIEQAGYTVLNLNVGNINMGSDALDIVAKDQPTEDYDEIALIGAAGVEASLIKGIEIYYAFVGNGEYTLTQSRIKDYNEANGTNISVTGTSSDVSSHDAHLTDDDLTNSATVAAVIQLGSGGYAQVMAKDTNRPDEETFPAGTEVGFVISTGGLLNIGVTPTLYLIAKDGKTVLYEKAVSSTILGLDISAGEKKFSIKAPCAFSGIKFMQFGVSAIEVTVAKYAFIVPEPGNMGHQCEMLPSADVKICSCDAKYQLNWDKTNFPKEKVTWTKMSVTPSSEADKVTFDAANDMLDFSQTDAYLDDSKNTNPVTVVMRIKNNDDDCYQDITIVYGGTTNESTEHHNETPLVNANSTDDTYALGNGTTAGVSILSIVKNSKNILAQNLNAHASYFGGVTIGDSYLCSVKKQNGPISDGSKALQAGFVVTAKGSGLNLDALKLMNVRIYNDGQPVGGTIETSAIAAKLIGREDTHKVRYSINVPAGTSFNEIRLYSSGLLGANLSVLNIYYAYTADQDAALDDPTAGATIVSSKNTGATIDLARTQSINTVNAGNGLTNIPNSIDGNLDDSTLFPIGVGVAGGTELAVKIGKTCSRHQQLVVVIDKAAAGLGVNLANAMVVKTYKTGVKDPVETFNDWSVLGANIITIGDKGYVFLDPKQDYDEVTISSGNGVSALSNLNVYGLMLRNDKDGDGTPDGDEMGDDCKQDIVFQETIDPTKDNEQKSKNYKGNLTMYFKRTFVAGKWNSLILPVSLNKKQFENAFGTDAVLAAADHLYEQTQNGVKQHVVGFKAVQADVDGTYLQANTPYIIWMGKQNVEGHKGNANVEYDTWDKGTISGEIYIVDRDEEGGGVTYVNNSNSLRTIDDDFTITTDPIMGSWGLTDLDFKGSYDPHQELNADDYIFNNGSMYHLTQSHTMAGFRCWLTPTYAADSSQAKSLTYGFGNETTGIYNIIAPQEQSFAKVYNLNGQRVDGMTGIQPGIYIVNGKKVVIR